ncbi:MAG TPA: hypothetical protein VK427_16005, partial [Kofleriaceae bacterium]|nr:hypothetical protein [Kofleriaceae bacterium]
MPRDLERPVWRGQRPWFEIWFAVLLDASRKRALWIRETMLVPRQGEGRATIWAAWFDADAAEPARAAKRYMPLDQVEIGKDGDNALVEIDGATMTRTTARGAVDFLSWDIAWGAGRDEHEDVPAWLPAPTHARTIAYDADASGTVTVAGTKLALRGRATAMHLWGKRRVPTLQWIWAPWI